MRFLSILTLIAGTVALSACANQAPATNAVSAAPPPGVSAGTFNGKVVPSAGSDYNAVSGTKASGSSN